MDCVEGHEAANPEFPLQPQTSSETQKTLNAVSGVWGLASGFWVLWKVQGLWGLGFGRFGTFVSSGIPRREVLECRVSSGLGFRV